MSSDLAKPVELPTVARDAAVGMSLSQDAWRRLKKNRVAMLSLALLCVITALAFLTPLLPLQTPDREQTDLQYTEPTLSPVWLFDFKLHTEAIANTPAAVAKLETELVTLKKNFAATKSGDEAEYQKARRALRRKEAEIQDTIQAPYRRLGFPKLGAISRWMVRVRYAVFGERSLNSLGGRDVFGRDTLSRVFWGARISLLVGLVATIVSLVIGVTYGAVSGYCGGWIDDAMMRFVDVLYSVPFIFVVIFLLTILGEERIADELAYWGINRITIFFFYSSRRLAHSEPAKRGSSPSTCYRIC
jgi:oligopeptide transport system permease protein